MYIIKTLSRLAVHHLLLHTLGINHEHVRPDREPEIKNLSD